MPTKKSKSLQILRLSVIALLAVLCLSAIAYSSCLVRYPVDGVSTTEFAITELSLTHSVERGLDGKLTNPYAGEESSILKDASESQYVIVVSVADNLTLQGLSAKKSIPKKPGLKKPAPKKPSPKKPAPKRPGKGKACPT